MKRLFVAGVVVAVGFVLLVPDVAYDRRPTGRRSRTSSSRRKPATSLPHSSSAARTARDRNAQHLARHTDLIRSIVEMRHRGKWVDSLAKFRAFRDAPGLEPKLARGLDALLRAQERLRAIE